MAATFTLCGLVRLHDDCGDDNEDNCDDNNDDDCDGDDGDDCDDNDNALYKMQ